MLPLLRTALDCSFCYPQWRDEIMNLTDGLGVMNINIGDSIICIGENQLWEVLV